jgi:hypothetical protein
MLKAVLLRAGPRGFMLLVLAFLVGNTVTAFFFTGGPVPRQRLPLPVPVEDVCYVSMDKGIFITNSAKRNLNEVAPLKVWSLQTGNELRTLQGDSDKDIELVLSPDGRYLFSHFRSWNRHYSDKFRRWDMRSGSLVGEFKLDPSLEYFGDMIVSPDNEQLFLSTYDKLVQWDVWTGALLEEDPELCPMPPSFRVRYCFDEKRSRSRCVIDADNRYEIWDAETHSLERVISWPEQYRFSCRPFAVTPDGQALVTTDGDGTVRVWSIDTGEMLEHYAAPCRPAKLFTSHSGRYILVDQTDDATMTKLMRQISPKRAHTLQRYVDTDAKMILIDRDSKATYAGFPSLRNTRERLRSIGNSYPRLCDSLFGFLDNEQTLAMITPEGILHWDLPPQWQLFSPSAWGWLAATAGFLGIWRVGRNQVSAGSRTSTGS